MFFVLLCIACFQDIRTGKISNLLIFAFTVTGGFYGFYLDGWFGVLYWLSRCLVYLAILYPLYKMGALGAGDVKLMAVVTGNFGWNEGVRYFICVWFFAGLAAFVKMLIQGNFIQRLEYFSSYIMDVVTMREWRFYYAEKEEAKKRDRTIYMSIPIFMGFVLVYGGMV